MKNNIPEQFDSLKKNPGSILTAGSHVDIALLFRLAFKSYENLINPEESYGAEPEPEVSQSEISFSQKDIQTILDEISRSKNPAILFHILNHHNPHQPGLNNRFTNHLMIGGKHRMTGKINPEKFCEMLLHSFMKDRIDTSRYEGAKKYITEKITDDKKKCLEAAIMLTALRCLHSDPVSIKDIEKDMKSKRLEKNLKELKGSPPTHHHWSPALYIKLKLEKIRKEISGTSKDLEDQKETIKEKLYGENRLQEILHELICKDLYESTKYCKENLLFSMKPGSDKNLHTEKAVDLHKML